MAVIVGGITLDNDMVWTDQYTYTKVRANVSRALTGREVIQISQEPTGRPITLESDNSSGWQSRVTVKQLEALAASYSTFNLQISGQTIAVRFRYEDGNPVSFQPISLFQPQDDLTEWWYSGTLLLTTV